MRLRPLVALGAIAFVVGGCDDGTNSTPGALVLAMGSASGDGQTAVVGTSLPLDLVARVTRDGVPQTGVAVAWTVVSGGGNLIAFDASTGADGLAHARWTLGPTAGTQVLRAAVADAGGSPLNYTATAIPGPAAALVRTAGDNQRAALGFPLPLPLVVTVRDAYGNAVSGTHVEWTVIAGAATFTPASVASNALGRAETAVTLGDSLGTVLMAANAAGLAGSPVAFSMTAQAAAGFIAEVDIGNFFFLPATIHLPANAQVRWTMRNTSGVTHNVTSTGALAFTSSGSLTGDGVTFETTFGAPGSFRYECTLHPAMVGTIIVP